MVTSAQLRAARGLLNWTVRDLSEKAGVHRNTITRAETDLTEHGHAVAQVVRTFEGAGVIFVDENGEGAGVRLRKKHKKPADVNRAMAERTAEFFSREEAVTQTNVREIQAEAQKHAGDHQAADNDRHDVARALAEERLDEHLFQVDAPAGEKERRKAALTKPPRRGPK